MVSKMALPKKEGDQGLDFMDENEQTPSSVTGGGGIVESAKSRTDD